MFSTNIYLLKEAIDNPMTTAAGNAFILTFAVQNS